MYSISTVNPANHPFAQFNFKLYICIGLSSYIFKENWWGEKRTLLAVEVLSLLSNSLELTLFPLISISTINHYQKETKSIQYR